MLNKRKIIFISTYPEKKCGIASFTQDLVSAIQSGSFKDYEINVCALDTKLNKFGTGSGDYPLYLEEFILTKAPSKLY